MYESSPKSDAFSEPVDVGDIGLRQNLWCCGFAFVLALAAIYVGCGR
jgi:hypothetical protein